VNNVKKEKMLANCIEEIESGKSTLEDCITRYPEIGVELRSLLEIASSIKPEAVTVSSEFKQRARLHLEREMRPAPTKVPDRSWGWPVLAPVRILVVVLVAVWVLIAAGGGTVYAAQGSLPGDALYPVKTGVENLQLSLTFGTVAKANLHLELAQKRIDEVTREVNLNRDINPQAIEAVQQQFDSALKELSKSPDAEKTSQTLSRISAVSLNKQLELENVVAHASSDNQRVVQQIIDETHSGNTIAQVAYSNHDFLSHQPSVSDNKLDSGRFSVEGTLLSIQDKTWNVGGTPIENVHFSGKAPAIGSRVKLEGLVKDKNTFITKLEISDVSSEPTKLEGQFSGTNQSGTSDISGIQVKINNDSNVSLQPGDNVQLQGRADDEKLTVTDKKTNKNDSANLNGVLTAVDIKKGTITIKVTGNLVKVNVSDAQLTNDHGQTLKMSELNHLLGRDVKLTSLTKKGDLIYCRNLIIEDQD